MKGNKNKRGILEPRKVPFLKLVDQSKYLLFMVFPGLAILLVYRYLPMVGLIIAFKRFSFALGLFRSKWVGLDNFFFLFTKHPNFFHLVRNTLYISLLKLVFYFPVPIFLALLINEVPASNPFKRYVQTIIYLPHFVSWVVFGSIVIQFLMPGTGLINKLITAFGGKEIFFMAETGWFRPIVVFTEIIKSSGWGSILYLAALTGINPELYEEAVLEGASRRQKTLMITIPCISDTIITLLLLEIGKLMNVGFEQIYVLYNPTVYSVGDVLSTYIYRIGIGQANYSITTAIGLFQSAIGLILILGANAVCKRLFDKTIW
ncbi:sugar ABC transporter permease [Treponema ruminis]|uniref:ABC transporter permease n=1 Tax=Treponema ruminis TaxID=744515 RepID=UPI00197F8CC2|nr:ABC transporter permease subunit [Treponema ruminis]QSI03320.1 sugar ABC transporter permease [Treponema ruminis]